MKTVVSIVGTRPNFTKLAGLSAVLKDFPNIIHKVIHTGQHFDANLSSDFFKEFGLAEPDYFLDVNLGDQWSQISKACSKCIEVLKKIEPDLVLVYGDSNATAAGALAASFLHIPSGHVEAGLREFDLSIPEEKNKLIVDGLSQLYFCPTNTAFEYISRLYPERKAYLTGDVVLDYIERHANKLNTRKHHLLDYYDINDDAYYFVTCHRAKNTDDVHRLESILSFFGKLDKPVLFPIHPRTKFAIESNDLGKLLEPEHIKLTAPLGFWDTQALLSGAYMVCSDSGGVIKEAYFHRKRAIVLQEMIEWKEILDSGWAKLIESVEPDYLIRLVNGFVIPKEHPLIFKADSNQLIANAVLEFLNLE